MRLQKLFIIKLIEDDVIIYDEYFENIVKTTSFKDLHISFQNIILEMDDGILFSISETF